LGLREDRFTAGEKEEDDSTSTADGSTS